MADALDRTLRYVCDDETRIVQFDAYLRKAVPALEGKTLIVETFPRYSLFVEYNTVELATNALEFWQQPDQAEALGEMIVERFRKNDMGLKKKYFTELGQKDAAGSSGPAKRRRDDEDEGEDEDAPQRKIPHADTAATATDDASDSGMAAGNELMAMTARLNAALEKNDGLHTEICNRKALNEALQHLRTFEKADFKVALTKKNVLVAAGQHGEALANAMLAVVERDNLHIRYKLETSSGQGSARPESNNPRGSSGPSAA